MRPLLLAFTTLSLLACPPTAPSSPETKDASIAPVQPPRKTVSLIVTGHETGQLIAAGPRLLARWKTEERWPEPLMLSTGDTFSGVAVSSYFLGAPTAEVMRVLGYRAAALGNHELDLGFDTLVRFATESGIQFLAANLGQRPAAQPSTPAVPFVVLERGGVKVGVVGLTSEKTVKTTVWGRAAGLRLLPLDEVLPAGLEGARKAGAQVLVVLVDDCFTAVRQAFEAHPSWTAHLVVGSRCEEEQEATLRGTRFLSIGDNLSHYVTATFTVKTDGAVSAKAERKASPTSGDEDAALRAVSERWQKQLDEALGQRIGFTSEGYAAGAPELRRWIVTALRDQTKADAAYINQKGVRAGLPLGHITRASVATMLPFENAVVLAKVPGAALLKLRGNPEAVFVGPAKLDPSLEYTVATTEYLYFGGDGLGLEEADPSPEPNGQMWQTPVVEWLLTKRSDEKRPLEKVLKP